jgi:hypothetical protein
MNIIMDIKVTINIKHLNKWKDLQPGYRLLICG